MSEGLKITGTITLRSHPSGTLHLYQSLVDLGKPELARELLADGKVEVVQKNLVVDSPNYGIDILVQYLISGFTGTSNFPLGIAWGEIGTGNTTPSAGDTALTAPTNRAAVSYAADFGLNTAQLQFFFPDAVLANTTYYECGSFIGGSSTIGSGNMFNHALFASGYSKSSGTDTTLEIDIAISN
ncbi:MAG TPA: hypothetical protein VKR52_04695 [Terracidiphilus sp.]|nr:hypothetical protein [Terracidiphilus sp.]